MSRKIFISFLGKTNYSPTNYYIAGNEAEITENIRFVQEASVKYFCSDFSSKDCIYILTTSTALTNWKDGEHKTRSGDSVWQEGLKSRLQSLNIGCEIKNREIPEGQSTKDIWGMFEIIFKLFQERDKVYFDITHGFRPFPMLNLVLINYAKLLKNITVSGIFYGAFEARKFASEMELTPIWDLTDFAKLQEWTNNASLFLNTGNARKLTAQITSDVYKDLKDKLQCFSEYNLVNRGMEIFDGQIMQDLNLILSKDIEPEEPSYTALKPILYKISSEFKFYKKHSTLNGFISVKWCIENGLIQQAATMLEESITTFLMGELKLINDINDYKKRMTISTALTINTDFQYEKKDEELAKWQYKNVLKVRQYKYKKDLGKLSSSIKESIRNDINHAGFRANPRDFKGFEESIIKRYRKTQKLIFNIKKIKLPDLDI